MPACREKYSSVLSRISAVFMLLLVLAFHPFPASGADDGEILRAAERAAKGLRRRRTKGCFFWRTGG